MVVGYARVSTMGQNLDRQLEVLNSKKCEKIFCEKVSGKSIENREQLKQMLDFIRTGDVVVVASFDRLGRNLYELLEIVKKIEEKGAILISDKEKVDMSSSSGKFFSQILFCVAELERNMILERQREGIAIAKAKGVYKGKQAKNLVGIEDYYKRWKCREIGITEIAQHFKVSRQTIYNHFKQFS